MERKTNVLKGWSCGDLNLTNRAIQFALDGQNLFEIPYNVISNVHHPSKNELGIELNADDDGAEGEDVLCDVRLYLQEKPVEKDAEADEVEGEGEGERDNNERSTEDGFTAESIKNKISNYANIGSIGDSLAVLKEVQMITPRGKSDVYMLKNCMKVHGATTDFKLPYKNFNKAFLLPKPDGIHLSLIISMHNPIRQGNTSYPFLVFQFKYNNETEIEVNLPENEEERKKILKFELQSTLKGEKFDIMAKLIKAMIGIGIIVPGNFKSARDVSSVKCSLKASEGYLYPLERCMLFIQKPVVYIALDDISYAEFSRMGDTNLQRTFDLVVHTKKGENYQFNGIERDETGPLMKYFEIKKIKVKAEDGKLMEIDNSVNITNQRRQRKTVEVPLDLPSSEDEFDEDFHSSQAGDDESDGSDDDMDVDDEDGGSDKKGKKEKKPKKKKNE